MSVLTSSPYSLAYGATVYAKVQAQNSQGWSVLSIANVGGATIQQTPSTMSAPTSGSSTSESQIEISWIAPSDGGSAISSYNLQWDSGTSGSTWTDVVGISPAYTSTSIILSTGITAGTSYQFKVRAQNVLGWGGISPATTIKAATIPSQMVAVTTSIDSSTGGVKITWTAPLDGSSTIDSYLIEIANSAQTAWAADTTNCDGASSTIISQMYCVIPMSTLAASFGYTTLDQLVTVRATAHNVYGYATLPSTVNSSGAKIRQAPDQMIIPTVDSYSDTSVTISWSALTGTATGNSDITSYNLQWDNGSGSTFTDLASQTSLTYTASGLSGGTTYQF